MVVYLEEQARVGAGRLEPDAAKAEPPLPKPTAQINFTDPESRIMLNGATKSFEQSYNTQNVVDSAFQIVIATRVVQDGNDKQQLVAMAEAIKAETGELPQALSADTGYFSTAAVSDETVRQIELYVALGRERESEKPKSPGKNALAATTASVAAETTGLTYTETGEKNKGGRPRLSMAARLQRINAIAPVISALAALTMHAPMQAGLSSILGLKLSEIDLMRCRLSTPHGKAQYALRKAVVEPVHGQIKEQQRVRRFQFRGLSKVNNEWRLITACHNLLKIWRHAQEKAMQLLCPRPQPDYSG
jgi:hypothetical protein